MVVLPVQVHNVHLQQSHAGHESQQFPHLAQVLSQSYGEAVGLAVVKPLALTWLVRTHTNGNKNKINMRKYKTYVLRSNVCKVSSSVLMKRTLLQELQ